MKALIRIELYKLFKSYRTYLVFGIAILLMLIIDLGLYKDGDELFGFLLQPVSENFFIEGNIVNGYLISYLALNTIWVHIPILIIIVSTHIFSSEFELGTIKTLLTQPIERTELMAAKIVAMVCFVIIFMLVVALSALLPALVLFGFGDVIVFIDGIQFIPQSTYLGRYILAILFSIISMVSFASLAMFFALYFRNTLSAILISIGILIISTLLQTFVIGFFSAWQPFLFTYHFAKWQLFFVDSIPVKTITNAVIFLLGMTLFFVALTIVRFKKMQITE